MAEAPPAADRHTASRTALWLTRPVPVEGARLRLLCFPHAGSGAAQFRPWAQLLPPGVELNPVRLPGRETRLGEPPFTRLDACVDAFLLDCAGYLDAPFAIFGHSMGALLGYRICQRLVDLGKPLPVHLFVSGRRAPHLPDPEPPIHALPTAALIAELNRRYGPSSTTLLVDAELQAIFLPILRADFELVETYSYVDSPPLDCPITAFGGIDDPRATEEELAAWRLHTSAAYELHRFGGDHFFHHPARTTLMAIVSAALSTYGTSSAR